MEAADEPRRHEPRIVVGALLVVAVLVAAISTAAVARDDEERVATGDLRDRTTSTSSTSTTSPLAVPSVDAGAADPPVLVPTPGASTRGASAAAAPTATAAPPPPPPPPPPPVGTPGPSTPCGGPVPTRDGRGQWTCHWADEFEGTAVDTSRWTVFESHEIGFKAGRACFVDRPDTVAVSGGALHLTVRDAGRRFRCHLGTQPFDTRYTGGMVSTLQKQYFTYGRFEIRAKLPATQVPGVHSAFWMWPSADRYGIWPLSGEIDVVEFYSQHPDRVIPYIHYAALDGRVTDNYCLVEDVTDWHTYVLEWTREGLTILYDGKVCLYTAINPAPPLVRPQPFDKPFMLSLTQALGAEGTTNAFDPAVTPLPATTVVDYVRVWQ